MLICLDQRTGSGCGAENKDGAQYCRQCGSPLRFALQLQNPGATIGHYRVVCLIGYGGFGAVYQAEDIQRPGTQVALKETFDPNSIRSFRSEFAILRQVRHSNLPRYYEVFEAQGNGYLAMEFVPGQSLDDVLSRQQGPLLESQVMGYSLQICDVLSFLHQQSPPIIHRDVKPANIRITPAGLIKLVDFGLLKQGGGTTASSRRGATPAYAPIEQYGTTGQHTDQRSDIYSLGATLYHLLTGQIPIPAADRLAASIDPLPPIRTLNPRISQQVADAVTTAANIFSKDRFPDAETFKRALLGARQPVQAPQLIPQTHTVPPTQTALPSPISKRPLAVTLVAAFCIITGLTNVVGVIAGLGMLFGKRWGQWLGIVYLITGMALAIGAEGWAVESARMDAFKDSYAFHVNYNQLLFGVVVGAFATLVCFALIALFQANVLDYFEPHRSPHSNHPERAIAISAWLQILLGFWLVLPLIFGMGLLYRKRWALLADRAFLILSIGLSFVAFIALAVPAFLGVSDLTGFSDPHMLYVTQTAFVAITFSLSLVARRDVVSLF